MAIVRNLFFLFSVTLFALTSTVLSISNYNPFTSNVSAFVYFYSSFFVALAGIIAIMAFYLKSKKMKNQDSQVFFWPSIRQASFVALALTGILVLQGLRILDLMIGMSIAVVLLLLELFFRTKKMV